MSYVIRHPSGQYVRQWFSVASGEQTSLECVEKRNASSYRKRSETREVVKQIPGATVEVR